MSSIFPLRDSISREEHTDPRLVDLDEETADEVFEALAASTTRKIFLALHEQPQTASDLAEETDTSVQNVQYHLQKLQDTELIEIVDTWYSERGSEMNVYAPSDESLVLYAGRDKQNSLRTLVDRFVGIVSLLVPASIIAGWAASQGGSDDGAGLVSESNGDGVNIGVEDVDMPDSGVEESPVEESEDVGALTAEPDTPDSDVYLRATDDQGSQIVIDQNQTEGPILITDGGNATTLPGDTFSGTTDPTVAGVDPALAVGLAFLLGGLFVVTLLWAWYGTPE